MSNFNKPIEPVQWWIKAKHPYKKYDVAVIHARNDMECGMLPHCKDGKLIASQYITQDIHEVCSRVYGNISAVKTGIKNLVHEEDLI